MKRIFGHYVAREMIALLAFEALVSCTAFYLLLLTWLHPHPDGVLAAIRYDGSAAAAAGASTAFAAAVLGAVGLYRPQVALEMRQLALNAALGAFGAFVPILAGVWIAVTYLGEPVPGRMWISKTMLCWLACVLVTRTAMKAAVDAGFFDRRVLLLGHERGDPFALQEGRSRNPVRTERASINAPLPDPSDLARRRVSVVVIAGDERGKVDPNWLVRCRRAHIEVDDHHDFIEKTVRRLDLERMAPGWLADAPGFPGGRGAAAVRRAADIALSLAILVAAAPVAIAAAIAIKIDSPGPVLYGQDRVGLHGGTFRIHKFRSMRTDAEANGAVWARKRDDRVTRVGAFLRRTRIDEIPQAVNVLLGEMSLIGPRPERPQFVEKLAAAIPAYRDREWIRPGLTGWAQVNFPYGASVEETKVKLSYDLYYVKNRSLFLDLVITLQTVRVMLFQEGSR